MFWPVKEEIFHLGTAMVTMAAMRPKIPSATHTICTPDEPILKEIQKKENDKDLGFEFSLVLSF